MWFRIFFFILFICEIGLMNCFVLLQVKYYVIFNFNSLNSVDKFNIYNGNVELCFDRLLIQYWLLILCFRIFIVYVGYLMQKIYVLIFIVYGDYRDFYCKNKQVIVYLFEWKWLDVVDECERFFGKKQFCGVQVWFFVECDCGIN